MRLDRDTLAPSNAALVQRMSICALSSTAGPRLSRKHASFSGWRPQPDQTSRNTVSFSPCSTISKL